MVRRILIIVIAVLLSGCTGSAGETATPTFETTFVPVVSIAGKIVPAEWATLSAQAGGTVLEVLVKPGDEVATGDLLVRLDSADAQLGVRRAELALESARAELALLQSGPLAEEIAIAEARVVAAEANLAQVAAQRDQLKAGVTDAEIQAARAQVIMVQADRLRAHEVHEQTMKCYHVKLPGGSKDKICPLLGPMEEQARYRLQAVDEQLGAAQAELDALIAGEDDQIRAVDAMVWAAAEQVDVAQAQLEQQKVGASSEEIASAEAAVQRAEAALAEAQVTLERSGVRAPFAGTVGMVQVRVGEFIAPGQSLITIGDLSTLRVETTDLDEIDVARVTVGQKVDVTFDVVPDRVFTGRVTRISPMAESDSGGVTYTALVELDELDPQIRWGMTAFVDIEVGR